MGHHYRLAVLVHIEHVFDAYAQLLFRNINSWLEGEDHSFVERQGSIVGVVHVQSHMMSEAMNEILAEWFAVQVFPVAIDVIHGDLVERVGTLTAQSRTSHLKCMDCSFLRTQHDVVDFPLPGRKLAVDRGRASDIAAYLEYSPATSMSTRSPLCSVPEACE